MEALLGCRSARARDRGGGRATGRGRGRATCRGRRCGRADRDVALVVAKQDDNALECASKDRPRAEQRWDQLIEHQQAGPPATAAGRTNSQEYQVRRPRAGDQKRLQPGAATDVVETVKLRSSEAIRCHTCWANLRKRFVVAAQMSCELGSKHHEDWLRPIRSHQEKTVWRRRIPH